MTRAILLVVMALTASGCAMKSTRLRKQAARDMGCNTFKVGVDRLPEDRYRAHGCHREAIYALDADDMPVLLEGPRDVPR